MICEIDDWVLGGNAVWGAGAGAVFTGASGCEIDDSVQGGMEFGDSCGRWFWGVVRGTGDGAGVFLRD